MSNEEISIKLKIKPVITITVTSDNEKVNEIINKIGEFIEQYSILSFTRKDNEVSVVVEVEDSGIIERDKCYVAKIIFPNYTEYYILNI